MDLSIVLVSPEIPGNTGSIGRTCLALGIELILIHPLGFDLDEKSVRRAGLDYWKHVKLTQFQTWKEFISTRKPSSNQLHFFTKTAKTTFFDVQFPNQSYLIFGSETSGLPPELLESPEHIKLSLPMFSEHVRSLNLSNAATAVAYECLRQSSFS